MSQMVRWNLSILLFATLASVPSLAREGRGMHKTKVKCASVTSLKDAERCFARVGEKMPTENDANAVLVSDQAQAKALLVELLTFQGQAQDIAAVNAADFVAAVVQNDDEASIYYYVLNKGTNMKPLGVGDVLSVVELDLYVCPANADSKADWPEKFQAIENLLLGIKTPVAGTVWADDVVCDEF